MKFSFLFLPLLLVLFVQNAFAGAHQWVPTEKPYQELKLKAHIWTNVFHDFDARDKKLKLTRRELEDIRARFPIAEDWEIIRVQRELMKGVRFFLINSRFNLNLNLETQIHSEFTLRSEITKGDAPYFTVKDDLYGDERNLAQAGSYDGLIHIERLFRLNENGELTAVRGGGGFTWGVDDEMKTAGISVWAMTSLDHPSNNFWLFVHEFHHQLDRMFELSGHPEYWFNHFGKPEGTAGPFGEHFDGNAWILRTWPSEFFADLKFGERRAFIDSDSDGLPDYEPALSFDEKWFGSLPTKQDSDGDRLSDTEEALLFEWVEPGLGERVSSDFVLPNPLSPDTDGDGRMDSEDPLPLFPVSPAIPQSDGWMLSASDGSGTKASLSLKWSAEGLEISISSSRSIEVKVLFDALGDGWWKENDNIFFTADSQGQITRKHVVNGASDEKWPFDDLSLLQETSISTTFEQAGDSYLYSFFIRADENYSFTPKNCNVVGLNVGFRQPEDSYYTVFFEPNVLTWLVLSAENGYGAEANLQAHNAEVMTYRNPVKPERKEKPK